MKPEYYTGLDLSLCSTGLVILDQNLGVKISMVISSKKKDVERLQEVERILVNTLKPFGHTFICMEGYSFGSRTGQAFSIGELGGIVKSALVRGGYEYKLISPPTLKKFVTGKGHSKKEMILKEVFKKWGMDFNDNNTADAYGLARMARSYFNRDDLTKAELELIKKI